MQVRQTGMSTVQYVNIDSAQRSSGTFSDFIINVGSVPIKDGTCELVAVNMYRSEYPFAISTEYTFAFQETTGGVTYATIPVGNYTMSALLTAIGSAMTAVSANTLTYTATYAAAPVEAITISATGNFIILATTTPVAWTKLGFIADNSLAASATGTALPNIAGVPYYMLSIDQLPVGNYTGAAGNFRIDLSAQYAAGNLFSSGANYPQCWPMRGCSNSGLYHVTVHRPDGNLAVLRNDWSFVLCLKEGQKSTY